MNYDVCDEKERNREYLLHDAIHISTNSHVARSCKYLLPK